MSESNTQHQTPYPRGMGGNGVPVLFSLRNVQPTIVAGGAKKGGAISSPTNLPTAGLPSANATATSPPTSTNNTTPTAPSVSSAPTGNAGVEAVRAAPVRNSNRFYNSVIVFLVLALCALALHNSRTNKPSSLAHTETGAAKSGTEVTPSPIAPSTPMLSNVSNLNGAPTPFLMGPSSVGKSSMDEVSEAPTNTLVIGNESASGASSNEETPSSLAAVGSQPQVTAKPPVVPTPMLLQSPTNPTSPANQANAVLGSADTVPIPATNVAYPVASRSNSFAVGNNSNQQAMPSSSSIEDTGHALPTKDLVELYNTIRGRGNPPGNNPSATNTSLNNASIAGPSTTPPTAPQMGAFASPSNASGYLNQTSAQLMSGQPYPPTSKDYSPLTIPAYEKNAVTSNATTGGNSAVRQTQNGSNRYQSLYIQQPQSSNPPSPYVPIGQSSPPNTGGNSVGYPPSNP